MPKKPIDLSRAKVYRIVSLSTGEQYIGSTCNELSKRMAQHRDGFRKWTRDNLLAYSRSYEVLKHGDAEIFLMEAVECKTRDDLLKREGELMLSNTCVNKCIPGKMNLQICKHGKSKYTCRECDGRSLCQHNKQKSYCVECDSPAVRKVVCKCGHECREYRMKEHLKSALHEKNMEAKIPKEKCSCTLKIKVTDMPAHLKSQEHLDYLEHTREILCECGMTYMKMEKDWHMRKIPLHKQLMEAWSTF